MHGHNVYLIVTQPERAHAPHPLSPLTIDSCSSTIGQQSPILPLDLLPAHMELTESGAKARLSGADDIRLPENRCGCVYTIGLDANYTSVSMAGLVCGDPVTGLIPGLGASSECWGWGCSGHLI